MPARSAHTSPRSIRAFTLIELMLVIVLITILATMAAPAFARFSKSSALDQAANVVLSALKDARLMSQRYRSTVAVFYGDDPARYGVNWVPPLSSTLPANNHIEIWSVKLAGKAMYQSDFSEKGFSGYEDEFSGSQSWPNNPMGAPVIAAWFPYYDKNRLLSESPYTIPDGIRVISGDLNVKTGNFSFPNIQATPLGEIKRHNNVYTRNGACPTFSNKFCYRFALVYDTATGDYVVIKIGDWRASCSAFVVPQKIKTVKGVPLVESHDLIEQLDLLSLPK